MDEVVVVGVEVAGGGDAGPDVREEGVVFADFEALCFVQSW